MLGKRAKTLSEAQISAILGYLSTTRHGLRNSVIFLLSLHGLRAKEIANLELSMITGSDGELADHIAIQDKATKGKSGRVVPMNKKLQASIASYLPTRLHPDSKYLITTERSEKFSANAVAVFFKRLYLKLEIQGASSHSGRRTFITQCARKITQAGGSIRDVQFLAGHRHLSTTQRYIDQDPQSQRKLVDLIYNSVR